jgi:hypothetical protein
VKLHPSHQCSGRASESATGCPAGIVRIFPVAGSLKIRSTVVRCVNSMAGGCVTFSKGFATATVATLGGISPYPSLKGLEVSTGKGLSGDDSVTKPDFAVGSLGYKALGVSQQQVVPQNGCVTPLRVVQSEFVPLPPRAIGVCPPSSCRAP